MNNESTVYKKKKLSSNQSIRVILISMFALSLIVWSILYPPKKYGDGWEYLAMTVSIANHFTPVLNANDISVSTKILERNGDKVTDPHAGYFEDLQGKWYSYHFWFYSLLVAIPYVLLKLTGINTFLCFQLANVLLYSLAIFWLAFRFHGEKRVKNWLFLTLLVNPILLYLPWTHPEVYTFVFLFIGILEYLNNRKIAAIVLTAIASFQNPGAVVVTAFIVMEELYLSRRITKRVISLGFYSLIVFFPYLWTWLHYRKLSIISEVATDHINAGKAFNLFFDLNSGVIVYVPVLLIGLMWLCVKREAFGLKWTFVLTTISLICSVQINWNSGMAYINRYGAWIIPIFMIAMIPLVIKLNERKLFIVVSLFTLTTGGMLIYCFNDYDYFNCIKFQPVAKLAISTFPALYNPPFDVFAERAYGYEVELSQLKESIVLANDHGIRKTLTVDHGHMKYVNASPILADAHHLVRLQFSKTGADIFTDNLNAIMSNGWYYLEKTQQDVKRWVSDDVTLLFETMERKNATISFNAGSFYKPRHMQIFLNDALVYTNVIPAERLQVDFTCDLKKFNKLTIRSSEVAQAPSELPELKNPDTRKLSFELRDFTIK